MSVSNLTSCFATISCNHWVNLKDWSLKMLRWSRRKKCAIPGRLVLISGTCSISCMELMNIHTGRRGPTLNTKKKTSTLVTVCSVWEISIVVSTLDLSEMCICRKTSHLISAPNGTSWPRMSMKYSVFQKITLTYSCCSKWFEAMSVSLKSSYSESLSD